MVVKEKKNLRQKLTCGAGAGLKASVCVENKKIYLMCFCSSEGQSVDTLNATLWYNNNYTSQAQKSKRTLGDYWLEDIKQITQQNTHKKQRTRAGAARQRTQGCAF